MEDSSGLSDCSSEDNDNDEPKLKYSRLLRDLKTIMVTDAISTVKVHYKYLCLGTHMGRLYLFDHTGILIGDYKDAFPVHQVSINQISVDDKGEFIGTCSDDGQVVVNDLVRTQNDQRVQLFCPVKCIQIDAQFAKPGSGRRYIVGDANLTLYEKSFYKPKSTVLCASQGVTALEWCEQYVAWASSKGVHVYNLIEKCSLGFIPWEEPVNSTLDQFRCNLRWTDATTLLIGWVDTIRICVLRKRNLIESRDQPGIIVDPISTFRTDFYISGLAPLEKNELVVLGVPKERDPETGASLRPLLCVLQYKANDYVEICTDSLTLRGYQKYKVDDYWLDFLQGENQFFVVSPKDVVVASLLENDDLVAWLIEHRRFERAMEVIGQHGGRYSLLSVARIYVDNLLAEHRYEEAAQLCSRTFKNDTALWEEEVYKFVKIQQSRTICPYLPQTVESKLNPHVYEIILYEYLKMDPPGFLKLIKEWDPTLYNTSAVRNAVTDHITEENKVLLLEAIAILYTYEKNYDQALGKYLKLQHRDVFKMIRTYDLYGIMGKYLIPLMQLDSKETIAILLDKRQISAEVVVNQLQRHPEYLLEYLDNYVKRDPIDSGRYHWQLLVLYMQYSREKLLAFLRRSHNYPIREAYELCEKERMHEEMVYLLDKMGNTHEAIAIIVREMKDIQKAIQYCKQINDVDLWNALIKMALADASTITKLMDGIAGYIDPQVLVNEIEYGQEITGLKQSLTKMMKDYRLQVEIQEKCNEILATDYFNIHERFAEVQQRGVAITDQQRCGKCTEEIFGKDQRRGVVLFNCHHFFHDSCLPSFDFCIVCKSKKQS